MLIFQAWATCGMVDCLIDWLFDWLTDSLTIWMVDLLMDWPFDWLTDWLTVWMVYWVMDRLFDGLTAWLTGHPSSQRRRSWTGMQQSSTITSCSYIQSMRKDCFRAIFSLPYEQQSTLYSPKRKQRNYILQRHWTFISQNIINYTEGHGQKEDHFLDSTRLIKSLRQHWSWSITLQDLCYSVWACHQLHKSGLRAICQAALKQFILDLQLYMYTVWHSTNHLWGTSRCHFITFTLLHLHEWPTQCEAIILSWVMHWSLQTISLISTGKH